jgi:transposase
MTPDMNAQQCRELLKALETQSWVKTPSDIRKLGGALFADRRYNTVFVYHNGASAYFAGRGFRGSLKV